MLIKFGEVDIDAACNVFKMWLALSNSFSGSTVNNIEVAIPSVGNEFVSYLVVAFCRIMCSLILFADTVLSSSGCISPELFNRIWFLSECGNEASFLLIDIDVSTGDGNGRLYSELSI